MKHYCAAIAALLITVPSLANFTDYRVIDTNGVYEGNSLFAGSSFGGLGNTQIFPLDPNVGTESVVLLARPAGTTVQFQDTGNFIRITETFIIEGFNLNGVFQFVSGSHSIFSCFAPLGGENQCTDYHEATITAASITQTDGGLSVMLGLQTPVDGFALDGDFISSTRFIELKEILPAPVPAPAAVWLLLSTLPLFGRLKKTH